MLADYVIVWAAAVNLGHFVDDAAAVVPAVTDVIELPAAAASTAVALTSLLLQSLSMDLLLSRCMWLSKCLLKVLL